MLLRSDLVHAAPPGAVVPIAGQGRLQLSPEMGDVSDVKVAVAPGTRLPAGIRPVGRAIRVRARPKQPFDAMLSFPARRPRAGEQPVLLEEIGRGSHANDQWTPGSIELGALPDETGAWRVTPARVDPDSGQIEARIDHRPQLRIALGWAAPDLLAGTERGFVKEARTIFVADRDLAVPRPDALVRLQLGRGERADIPALGPGWRSEIRWREVDQRQPGPPPDLLPVGPMLALEDTVASSAGEVSISIPAPAAILANPTRVRGARALRLVLAVELETDPLLPPSGRGEIPYQWRVEEFFPTPPAKLDARELSGGGGKGWSPIFEWTTVDAAIDRRERRITADIPTGRGIGRMRFGWQLPSSAR